MLTVSAVSNRLRNDLGNCPGPCSNFERPQNLEGKSGTAPICSRAVGFGEVIRELQGFRLRA